MTVRTRIRRGKEIVISREWYGKVPNRQTIKKRPSKMTRKMRNNTVRRRFKDGTLRSTEWIRHKRGDHLDKEFAW